MKKIISSIFIIILIIFMSSCSNHLYHIIYLDDDLIIEEVTNQTLAEAKKKTYSKEGYIFDYWDITIDNDIAYFKAQFKEQEIDYQLYDESYASYIYDPITKEYEDINIYYNPIFFKNPSTLFNKDLAIYSLSISAVNTTEGNYAYNIIETMGYDNIYKSPTYEITPTIDSVAYIFAHKKIFDEDLVLITPRSTGYLSEWANNFLIGESGIHQGFNESADIIYQALIKYLNDYQYNNNHTKLLITGYSRSAGIINALNYQIINSLDIHINLDYIYAYAFAAPLVFDFDSGMNNLFNVYNSEDIFTFIPFTSWGFQKGQGINVYSELINQYYEDTFNKSIPAFKINEALGIYNTLDIVDYLLLKISTSKVLINRTAYQENLEDVIIFLFALLNNESVTSYLSARLKDYSVNELLSLLTSNALIKLIKEALGANDIEYDNEELETILQNFIVILKSNPVVLSQTFNILFDNIGYLMENHNSSVLYSLLIHYEGENHA